MSGASAEQISFGTTIAHQAFLLVSTAFCFFELIFLWLYSDRGWFATNLLFWTIPVAIFTVGLMHLFLQWLETTAGCRCTGLVSKGLPAAPYRRWVTVNQSGFAPAISYGKRRIVWSAIDGVELTLFGNLLLLSRATTGAAVKNVRSGKERDTNPPALVFKIPFGIASRHDQRTLIAMLMKERPECTLNSRLLKQINSDEPRGSAMVLNIVSLCFLLFFLDVIFSTFSYLEILKNYTLAKESAEATPATSSVSEQFFRVAENLRKNPLPISWVTRKMFQSDSSRSGLMQNRADALWAMNKKEDAILSMRDALEKKGKNFRAELKLARMLVETHQISAAFEILDKASEKSKKAFVPKMYILALLKNGDAPRDQDASQFYKGAMKSLDEELFKDDNGWPPDVSPYLPDVWHREDVEFVFTRLIKSAKGL